MFHRSDNITYVTRLSRHYRDDGPDRVFIPAADAELSINYYICYLAKNEKWLRPFLTWTENCISGFEEEQ
jgi:hypothetical protein